MIYMILQYVFVLVLSAFEVVRTDCAAMVGLKGDAHRD